MSDLPAGPDTRIAELERVLRMAHYELLTLMPRLGEPYRASAKRVKEEIEKVIKP